MLLTRLRTEGEQAQKALASKQHELAVALAEVAKLRAQGAQNAQLEALRTRATELETRVAELDKELARRTESAEQARAENAKLEEELSTARDDSTRTSVELAQAKAKIVELEQALETARSEASKSVPPTAAELPTGADDLTSIKGIGPKFQRVLYAAGIRSFADIAAWTDAEVDAIAPKLKVRAERIRRERWVEHARELCESSR